MSNPTMTKTPTSLFSQCIQEFNIYVPYQMKLHKSMDGYDSIFTYPVVYYVHVLSNNVYIHI